MAPKDAAGVQLLGPPGLVSSPAFSHVAVIPPGATTVLVGGQNGVDEEGELAGPDIGTQTARLFDNLVIALAAVGATISDVVQWRILVVDGVDPRPGFEEFQRRWDMTRPPPLLTVAVVAGLAVPGALVELDAVAVLPPGRSDDVVAR